MRISFLPIFLISVISYILSDDVEASDSSYNNYKYEAEESRDEKSNLKNHLFK